MGPDSESSVLPLAEAILLWSDPALVEVIRREEHGLSAEQISSAGRLQLRPRTRFQTHHQFGRNLLRGLNGAWDALERDFGARVLRGEIYLRGVQVAPEMETAHRGIPSVWASEFRFDVRTGAISVHQYRYTAVLASRSPFLPSSDALGGTEAATAAAVRPEDVPNLDDETILALLEEHGRRVVRNETAKLIAPGKVSFLPIIRRKMEYRARAGELLRTLSAEAAYLERWIASKITHHQLPTASTIGKVLGSEYAVLKARSTGAIQQSNP